MNDPTMISPHNLLRDAREKILVSLVDLAAEGRQSAEAQIYRARAEAKLRDLSETEKALAAISPGATTKYAGFKRAIDAILDLLNEVGRPMTEATIIKTLCDGGFRGASPGTTLVIEKSIRSYLSGTGLQTVEKNPESGIKKVGPLLGRADWDEGMFR